MSVPLGRKAQTSTWWDYTEKPMELQFSWSTPLTYLKKDVLKGMVKKLATPLNAPPSTPCSSLPHHRAFATPWCYQGCHADCQHRVIDAVCRWLLSPEELKTLSATFENPVRYDSGGDGERQPVPVQGWRRNRCRNSWKETRHHARLEEAVTSLMSSSLKIV